MKRLSRTGLLLLLAFSVPILVELRTILAFVGIELSGQATIAVAVVFVGALLLWRLASVEAEANGS